MISRACAVLLMCAVSAAPAFAAGSAEAGKAKAVTCGACHGANGQSANPEWPSLAGQHTSYLYAQLQAYKSGDRVNVLMSSQAMGLEDQDMQDLAAYFAAQPPARGEADPALAKAGERLYRGGDLASGVSACIACHGPHGRGNPAAGIPMVAGQHAVYAAAQLRAYAAGERRSDMNQMMRNIASRMSEEQIVAVSSFLQGLR